MPHIVSTSEVSPKPSINQSQQDNIIHSMLKNNCLWERSSASPTQQDRETYNKRVREGYIGSKEYSVLLNSIMRFPYLHTAEDLYNSINDDPTLSVTDSKHVRAILSKFTRGSIAERDTITAYDMQTFLDSPNGKDVVMFDNNAQDFLPLIEDRNGISKRLEYEEAIDIFGLKIFGKQWEYLKQIKELEKKARKPNPEERKQKVQDIFFEAREKSQLKNEKIYILKGIHHIKEGRYTEALKHFQSYKNGEKFGLHIEPGEYHPIPKLKKPEDVTYASAVIASHSRTNESGKGIELGGVWPNTPLNKFEDMPELYDPEMLQELYKEWTLVMAEEWLHTIQIRTGETLAGEEDHEVDVAAFFHNEGILTENFINRYAERQEWYTHLNQKEQ